MWMCRYDSNGLVAVGMDPLPLLKEEMWGHACGKLPGSQVKLVYSSNILSVLSLFRVSLLLDGILFTPSLKQE